MRDGGVESVIIDDNMGRMLGWNVVGGFKLQVNKADADLALQLLRGTEPHPSKPDIQPTHCPNCDSTEVTLQESDSPAGYTGTWPTHLVIDNQEKSWEYKSRECKSCGYCWGGPEER